MSLRGPVGSRSRAAVVMSPSDTPPMSPESERRESKKTNIRGVKNKKCDKCVTLHSDYVKMS